MSKTKNSEVRAYIYIKEQLKLLGWDTRNPSRHPDGEVYTQQECLSHPEIKKGLTHLINEILKETKPDIVIHLAAVHFIPYCNEHPLQTLKINVLGTRYLLESCKEYPPEVFFFASTAAVYPIRDEPNREDSEVGPSGIYGTSKLIGEDLVRLFHLETGVRALICRFFNMYGPNETNPHLIPEIINQIKTHGTTLKLGNLEAKRDFITA